VKFFKVLTLQTLLAQLLHRRMAQTRHLIPSLM
jgi:hypothetical protein